jgi:prepilin-type N-terminal cleavage/methylation domain-containing protein
MSSGTGLRSKSGFTLIELAIVLVIIGLLLGAILKGQEMIKNAKIKRIKSDIDSIVAATYSYQDRYNYLPGDDPTDRSGAPPVGLNAANCGGGNGNGLFSDTTEETCFWQELAGAGFISGDPTQHDVNEIAKKSPYGTIYIVRYGTHGNERGNYIETYYLPNDVIYYLDTKYDDGVYNTGNIQSNNAYTSNTNSYLYWFAF